MAMELLSSLPLAVESIPKMTAEGGQLIADLISVYGFFAFCLVFVGFCLIAPALMYEKYYRVADDETTPETAPEPAQTASRVTDPAA